MFILLTIYLVYFENKISYETIISIELFFIIYILVFKF